MRKENTAKLPGQAGHPRGCEMSAYSDRPDCKVARAPAPQGPGASGVAGVTLDYIKVSGITSRRSPAAVSVYTKIAGSFTCTFLYTKAAGSVSSARRCWQAAALHLGIGRSGGVSYPRPPGARPSTRSRRQRVVCAKGSGSASPCMKVAGTTPDSPPGACSHATAPRLSAALASARRSPAAVASARRAPAARPRARESPAPRSTRPQGLAALATAPRPPGAHPSTRRSPAAGLSARKAPAVRHSARKAPQGA